MIAAAIRHGVPFLLIGAAAQAVFGFLAQLVLMQNLVPADFGAFAVALAGVSLIQAVVSLRLVPAIMRCSEADLTPAVAERFYSGLCWESVAATLLTLVWLVGWGPSGPWPLVLLVTLSASHWVNQMVVFYERGMTYRRLATVETGVQLVGHGMAVVLVLAGAGAASLYLRELVVMVIKLALFYHLKFLPRLRWRWLHLSDWRILVAEAKGLYAEGMLEGLYQRLVILTADAILGKHGTGVLAQGQRLAGVPHQFLQPFSARYAANLFGRQEDSGHRRAALWRVIAVISAPLAAMAVAAIALADPVVPMLFGAQWQPAAPVLVALSGFILFNSLFEVVRAYAMVVKANSVLIWARVAQMGVFAAFAGVAVMADNPAVVLALGLSAACAAAFAVGLVAALSRRGGN